MTSFISSSISTGDHFPGVYHSMHIFNTFTHICSSHVCVYIYIYKWYTGLLRIYDFQVNGIAVDIKLYNFLFSCNMMFLRFILTDICSWKVFNCMNKPHFPLILLSTGWFIPLFLTLYTMLRKLVLYRFLSACEKQFWWSSDSQLRWDIVFLSP